jgi:hypothetical protein
MSTKRRPLSSLTNKIDNANNIDNGLRTPSSRKRKASCDISICKDVDDAVDKAELRRRKLEDWKRNKKLKTEAAAAEKAAKIAQADKENRLNRSARKALRTPSTKRRTSLNSARKSSSRKSARKNLNLNSSYSTRTPSRSPAVKASLSRTFINTSMKSSARRDLNTSLASYQSAQKHRATAADNMNQAKDKQEKDRQRRLAKNNAENEKSLMIQRGTLDRKQRDFKQQKMQEEAKLEARAARIEQDKLDFAEEKAR